MPLYEYQCKACRHRFEVIQKFSDKPVGKCPKCGKSVERLLSSPAIQFKGTGWYVTDYANRSQPGKDNSDSKAEQKPAAESAAAVPEKPEKQPAAAGSSVKAASSP